MRSKGFTLIELLIVIAIIGVLSAVLLPNLTRARTVAQNRATQVYGANIYRAALAFQASDPANIIPLGSCASSYTAGSYVVFSPGSYVQSCTVSDPASNGKIQVTVSSVFGAGFTLP